MNVLINLSVMFGLVPATAEALDIDDLSYPSPPPRSLDRDDKINGLADHSLHRLLTDLGGQLLQTTQGGHGGIGVNGGDATGMASIPGFQQRQCGAIADFANDDAVGTRSEEHTAELQSIMRITYALFCL